MADPNHDDLGEIKKLLTDIRGEFVRDKAEEDGEKWTSWASMTIVFIAILATVSSQIGSRSSDRVLHHLNESNFNSTLASNQWSYFQSKSIKQNLYEIRRSELPASTDPEVLAEMTERIDRYEGEKQVIFNEAKAYEVKRDESREKAKGWDKRATSMGRTVRVFAIAVAVGSVCLLTKRKYLFYLTLAFAAFGIYRMIVALMIAVS